MLILNGYSMTVRLGVRDGYVYAIGKERGLRNELKGSGIGKTIPVLSELKNTRWIYFYFILCK